MNFGNEKALLVLIAVVPICAYLGYRVFRIMRNIMGFADKNTAKSVLTPADYRLVALKYVLLFAGMALLVIALARPQGKPIPFVNEASGIDIMIAMDVSSSMGAVDMQPNRMEVVKKGLHDFINSLAGDRVGMMTFAGVDFIQCPLTLDYETLNLIIDGLYPGMLSKDGTALDASIKSSVDRLQSKGGKSKILILITDGENTEGGDPISAARYAAEKGIRIYTVGVGTKEGGKIPEGRDAWGRIYYKIYKGSEVISKLDDSELRQIAGITGGKFYRITDSGAFRKIKDDTYLMEKNKNKKEQVKYEENYTVFLLWALIFFILYYILPVRADIFKIKSRKNSPIK
ncbi:MAG TPA: VWA domain-containing protein [Candidatus Goldiibacteriota bacterium]|nr:VWA domain-containing protein [Candidatus Goldiibacteriota bacterium]HRQ44110.1 VWA domain-containing protein [Candidatus Goldiibacteriota bacterium]